MRVLLLEARDRVGGRILTAHEPDGIFAELGAEFVHGRPPEILIEAQKAGLPIDPDEHSTSYYFDGKHLGLADDPESESESIFLQFERYNGPDISFATFLDKAKAPEHEKQQAAMYVEGFNAAYADRISLRALAKQQHAEDAIHGGEISYVHGGYDRLVDAIRAQLTDTCELRCNTRVLCINWRPGEVVIEAAGDDRNLEFHARAAVVTLPLSLLQAGCVQFVPILDTLQHPLSLLEMGHVVRLSLRFDRAFWPSDLGFLFAQGTTFPVYWTSPGNQPILTAWTSGHRAEPLLSLSHAELESRVLQDLTRIFSKSEPELRSALHRSYYHDWQHDPYSLGSYSYPLVCGEDASADLSRPIANTLFFAGEHTESQGHHATVHGAIASGYRVAHEIVSALR